MSEHKYKVGDTIFAFDNDDYESDYPRSIDTRTVRSVRANEIYAYGEWISTENDPEDRVHIFPTYEQARVAFIARLEEEIEKIKKIQAEYETK